MSLRSAASYVCVLAAICLSGCGPIPTFTIDLHPAGDRISRTLAVSPELRNPEATVTLLSREQSNHLTAIYGDSGKISEDRNSQIFSGEFGPNMPGDIDGFGRYYRIASPMGDAYFYSERIGGSFDLEKRIERVRMHIERLSDLTAKYFENVIDDPELRDQVVQWCRTGLKDDANNLSFYLGLLSFDSTGAADSDIIVKSILQHGNLMTFLFEHDYVRTTELPMLGRAFKQATEQEIFKYVWEVIYRHIKIQTTELDVPSAADLVRPDALRTWTAFEESMSELLSTTPEYQQLRRDWESAEEPRPNEPKPTDALFQILLGEFPFSRAERNIDMTLHLPGEPLRTDGVWDAQTNTVNWHAGLSDRDIAAVVSCSWVEPDVEYQTDRFGEVRLEGQALVDYVMLYAGLLESEAEAWNEVIDASDLRQSSWRQRMRDLEIPAAEKTLAELREAILKVTVEK